MKLRISIPAMLLLLTAAPFFQARGEPFAEKQKIEALIQQIAELKDAKFLRNGSIYNAETAATFLRRKWAARESDVTTAREFIENIASISGTSGKPYVIRFKDGKEIKSRDFFLVELKKIEK